MTGMRYDRELQQYRDLMEVPSKFEEGFSWTALIGALFIAMMMVPGAMYMQLLAGIGVGPAAQWVTVILFIEVARRAHKQLRRPEIFVLFYMAGAVMVASPHGLNQGPVRILFHQFFAQSRAATGMGVAEQLPEWFAPTDPSVLAERNFFNPAWYPALGLVVFQFLMSRVNLTILSYGLFRVASDVEKLPFPMAPIGAQGITALAEQQSEESREGAEDEQANWRWRIFSIGGVLGMGFGALYTGLPTFSTAFLDEPITILPIPFTDWTQKTAGFLPAVATGLSFDMGQLVLGMVLPFFAMLGSFIGLMITFVLNPILYRFGILWSWTTADETVQTLFKNNVDFYFSFALGVAIAIALAGFWQVYRGLAARRRAKRRQQAAAATDISLEAKGPPPDRGDLRPSLILALYVIASMAYILVSGYLIDWHGGVMIVLFFFAFLYTPLLSYVTARMEGMSGQVVEIPMVREAAFILSGYTGGVKVWFLPIPMGNYGRRTVFWRQAELTGTRFWSLWKVELLLMPIVVIAAILFAQFLWSLSPIPGPQYPYAQTIWQLSAANQCIIYTATLGRFSAFEEAFRPTYVLAGAGFGVALFALMSLLHLPIMLVYGVVRGLNQTLPHVVIPQFAGALIGRYYFERRMGLRWRQYAPVIMAGFACGMGLITILGVGAIFLAKSVIKIPF
ncbi:MAG: peptide transporter [Phycisphaerae bacterium]